MYSETYLPKRTPGGRLNNSNLKNWVIPIIYIVKILFLRVPPDKSKRLQCKIACFELFFQYLCVTDKVNDSKVVYDALQVFGNQTFF